MSYKLFIDDERFPIGDDWTIVRSSQEAMDLITYAGMPKYISFDHDLGDNDTAMKLVHFMVARTLDTGEYDKFPRDFYVHSQNPIGKGNIESYMNRFIEFLDAQGK